MLLLFLVALSVFSPMFFMGKAIFHRDYHFITYPFRYFLGQAYQQGVIPYWAPNVYGGMPFMSLFHPGVFYPPSILFFLQDTVLGDQPFLFSAFSGIGSFFISIGKTLGTFLCSTIVFQHYRDVERIYYRVGASQQLFYGRRVASHDFLVVSEIQARKAHRLFYRNRTGHCHSDAGVLS